MWNWLWNRLTSNETESTGDIGRVRVTQDGWEPESPAERITLMQYQLVCDAVYRRDLEISKLQQQLAHTTEIADAHKAAYERNLGMVEAAGNRIEQLEDERSDMRVAHEKQVAELQRRIAEQNDMIGNLTTDNAYQTDLAKSFQARVHELETQLTRTQIELTESTAAHKETHNRCDELEKLSESRLQTIYAMRIELAEMRETCGKQLAEIAILTAANDELRDNYERLFGKLSDALWSEVEDDDDDEESYEITELGIAESVGEETRVINKASLGSYVNGNGDV